MESSSVAKRLKVIDDAHNMSETPLLDRLSEMPDSVLLHILSFIPTKYVVQMSILSRRWRYLWTSMPTLDLNDNLFYPPHQKYHLGSMSERMIQRYSDENMRFVGFVYRVLVFNDMSHIKRFRLTLSGSDIYTRSWIDTAITKNVQELYLDIKENYPIKLPDCLFTCESLVSLELNLGDIFLELPTSICFTRLRTLHLESVMFNKGGSVSKLVSSCPVLENLIMVQSRWFDDEVVNISSLTIQSLCMRDCLNSFAITKISTPNLTSFKYIDYFGKYYSFEKLSSLIDAFIQVKSKVKTRVNKQKESFDRVIKLLRGVSNARSLTLSYNTLEHLSTAPNLWEVLPTFHNLKNLILTSGKKINHLLVIACLLQSCPVVESLAIDIKVKKDKRQPSPNNAEPSMNKEEANELCLDSLECLLDHLKVVKISRFRGSTNEQEFMNLLLRNANNMEKVLINEHHPGDSEKKMVIRNNILMFQKAAANCIISFS